MIKKKINSICHTIYDWSRCDRILSFSIFCFIDKYLRSFKICSLPLRANNTQFGNYVASKQKLNVYLKNNSKMSVFMKASGEGRSGGLILAKRLV